MCVPNSQLDRKTRRVRVIANVALVLGILFLTAMRWHWLNPASEHDINWLSAMGGLFLGLSIVGNIFVLRRGACCNPAASGKL